MSANYTPEPWQIYVHGITGHGRERVIVSDADGLLLADCGFASSKVAQANARLLVEAPVMARLLQRYLDSVAHSAGAETLAVLRRINGYYDE